MGRLCFAACSLSIGLLAAGVARAEPAGPEASAAVAPEPGAANASPEALREADALLERAKVHFRAGQYREALPLVERALALTGAPRFLFNLGVLHHKLSECVPARDYFERYLERDAMGAARQQTLDALAELNAHCPRQAVGERVGRGEPSEATPVAPTPARSVSVVSALVQPAEPASTPPPSNESGAGPARESGWAPPPSAVVLMGLGAAAGVGAVVALVMQGRAQSDLDALGSSATGEQVTWDAFEAERQALSANARQYRNLSIGLGAASVALLGAGATVWVVEANDAARPRAAGLGVAYFGRF